jgi:hypothetical protein
MVNRIKWLEEEIQNSNTPVLVYIKNRKCDTQSKVELGLLENIKKLNEKPKLFSICYSYENIPFPEPHWNRLYFFEPKNQTFIQSWDANYILDDFENLYSNFEAIIRGEDAETYKAQKENPELVEEVRSMVESEDISKYPSNFQMARNLFKEAWKSTKGVVKTGKLLTDAKTAQDRINTCIGCEFFNKEDKRCTQCGCFMEQKVHLKTAQCPKALW